MELITYDDFAKLDIRIGLIQSVEIVEGADKLLKLMVDLGDGLDEEGNPRLRQILSAIRLYLDDPQELVGKRYPFLANLEPRMIRGLESQGMIMAVGVEDKLAFLVPTLDVSPGTKVN
jgi:methionyl-tRNA synthetase